MSMSNNARPGQPAYTRSSSFARSFFQAGMGEGTFDTIQSDVKETAAAAVAPPTTVANAGSANNNSIPLHPRAAMRRRASRRRLSEHNTRNSDGAMGQSGAAAAAAAATAEVGEGEPGNLPGKEEASGKADRSTSWYMDALVQGGNADKLTELLNADGTARGVGVPPSAAAGGGGGGGGGGFDDVEVLEQYRIMAQHEANLRVKENTGFDMAEYEQRRKLQPDSGSNSNSKNTGRKQKLKLPNAKPASASNAMTAIKLQEPPPSQMLRIHREFVQQRISRAPEICPGQVVRGGSTNVPDGEHVVRCLGCRAQLRVSTLALMVSCPDCQTVSPASSTRR